MQNKYPRCPINGHDLIIQDICLEKNCYTTPYVCCSCGRERHQDHINKLRSLDEIKRLLREKHSGINQSLNDFKKQIDDYKAQQQLELIFRYELDQIKEFLQLPNYQSNDLEKIASILKKEEHYEIHDAQKQELSEFMNNLIMVFYNITKNIDYKFSKKYALFDYDITIQEHDNSKFVSMKGKSGLFTIEPQLNDIKLKTIIMKFKFQNVNWLYLGVTNEILNYEKNVACITNHGTLYSTFNDQQQNTKQLNFQISHNDIVQITIIKAEKQMIITNQTKNCLAILSDIDFKDMKFFIQLMETEVYILD